MTIVILIFISVIVVVLLQAKKEYKNADKNINSLILEAANATSEGDYNRAIQLLTSALNQNSMYHNVWNSRGENYVKLGMYQQALYDFNKSISIKPNKTINYLAYQNRDEINRLISINLPNAIPFISKTSKIINYSEINLHSENTYKLTNLYPYEFGWSDSESNTISNSPQSIIINLQKDELILSEDAGGFLHGNEFIILNIIKSDNEDYYLIRLISKKIGVNPLNNDKNVIMYKNFGIDMLMKDEMILFREANLNFTRYLIFNININWRIEKY